ncbi:MAG: four helix bundle protein [Betaproteobacteria bacterium]|nr:four helix bundle protein [Betaproteobacteria bacterium]
MKRNHRNLRAWQQAVELVSDIYRLTAKFPDTERYGLTSQMRRAAVSAPANIAEGSARAGTKELLHFLSMSSGSLSELDTLLEVAKQLGYVKDSLTIQAKIDAVSGLIIGLRASLLKRI